MDNRQIALKLVLDELGIPADIDTIDDRKKVQKAVYLGQISGLDLGYRFGWYLLGPYSSDLTKDYYGLASALGATQAQAPTLRPEAKEMLSRVRPLMAVPSDVSLTQEDWLELLASHHFLRVISKYPYEQAVETMRASPKIRLTPYSDRAESLLRETNLL